MKREKRITFDVRTLASRLTSEVVLQQLIAGLLTRMPDVTSVQILQGSQEYGKDLVFTIQGGFGDKILCACVVKNVKITGTVDSSRGARTIFLQAEQALDTPHLDDRGREISVERVYIVTPFDLAPTTIRSITGKLAMRTGRVLFISGSQLFDLFKQYWPSVLVDEFGAASYLSAAIKELSDEAVLFNLEFNYQLGTSDKGIRSIYVPPTLYCDLCLYSLSETMTAVTPSVTELRSSVNERDVERFKISGRRFSAAVEALQEWGYVQADSHIGQELERLIGGVTRSWVESREKAINDFIAKKLRNSKPIDAPQRKVSRILAAREERAKTLALLDVEQRGVKLKDAEELSRQALLIQKGRDASFKSLDQVVRLSRQFVQSVRPGDSHCVFRDGFREASQLDEFVRQGPPGVFYADELQEGNYFSQISGESPKVATTRVSCSSEILNGWGGSILILGPAGYGKTSLCRRHALIDAERYSTGESPILPLYVSLHKLEVGKYATLGELVASFVGRSALLSQTQIPIDFKKQRFRVYLDGLDEIASPEKRSEILAFTQRAVEKDPNVQLIVTSREYAYGRSAHWLPMLRLSEFDDKQSESLIDGWLSDRPDEHQNIVTQLDRLTGLKPLMRVPLLATLVILVFRQTRRLPENRTRLYEIFADLLSGGWDLVKGIQRRSSFGTVVKLMVLRRLAAKMHLSRRKECGGVDLKYAIRSTLSSEFVENWARIEEELLQDGLITRNGSAYEFSHLSFQEYLTAKDLLGDPKSRRIERVLEEFLAGDDWWREVLCFYAGLSGKPDEMFEWLAEKQVHLSVEKVQRCEDLRRSIEQGLPVYIVGTDVLR